jgi:hypothetical protein
MTTDIQRAFPDSSRFGGISTSKEIIRTFLPRFKGLPTDTNDFDFYSLNLQTNK